MVLCFTDFPVNYFFIMFITADPMVLMCYGYEDAKSRACGFRNLKSWTSRSAQLPGQIRCKLAAARSSRSSRVRLAETLRGAPLCRCA